MALFGRRQNGDSPAKPSDDLRDAMQPRPYPRPEALTNVTRATPPGPPQGTAQGTTPNPASAQPTTAATAMQPAAAVAVDPTRRALVDGITAPSGPAAAANVPARRPEARTEPRNEPRIESRIEEAPAPASDYDGKKLIVGKQIVLSGEIKACDKLIVEGKVEAALTDCHSIEILGDGLFKGSATIDVADISGKFEGDLIVRERLLLRGTGRISGNVRYGEMQIERGGVVAGDMRPIDEDDLQQPDAQDDDRQGSGGADGGARGG